MHAIYRNSALTIVAACTKSAWGHFLKMSVPLLAFEGNLDPFQVSIKLPENESTIVQLRPTPYHDRFASPINHRAWALQEQVMSPHLVIFTPDGIEMVCKAMHGSREILDVRSRSLIANSKQRSTSWYRITRELQRTSAILCWRQIDCYFSYSSRDEPAFCRQISGRIMGRHIIR